MSPKFSSVPVSAFMDPRLSGTALRVLGVLCNYTDRNGMCFPTQKSLAKRLGLSRQVVNYQVRFLREAGYLLVERRKNEHGGETSCAYRVLDPTNPVATESSLDDTPEKDTHAPPDHQNMDTPEDPDFAGDVISDGDTASKSKELTQTLNLTEQKSTENYLGEVVEGCEVPSQPSAAPEGSLPNLQETPRQPDGQRKRPGRKPGKRAYPRTIVEAGKNPSIQVYRRVTGIMPIASHFARIVDAIEYLQESYPTEAALAEYLTPLWERWKGSKRKDGRSYNPNNPAWLTEWAVSGVCATENSEPCESYQGGWVIPNPTPEQRARALKPMRAGISL